MGGLRRGAKPGPPRIQIVEHAERLRVRQIGRRLPPSFSRICRRHGDRNRARLAPPRRETRSARTTLSPAGAYRAMDEERFRWPSSPVVQHHRDGGLDHSSFEWNLKRAGNRASLRRASSNCIHPSLFPPRSPVPLSGETSSPPSTLITFPVIQSAAGFERATIAPPRSARRRPAGGCGFRCVAISTSFSLPGILRSGRRVCDAAAQAR